MKTASKPQASTFNGFCKSQKSMLENIEDCERRDNQHVMSVGIS